MFETNNWDDMVFDGVGSKHAVRPVAPTSTEATVVEVVRRERDSYGEGYEGDSGNCYVIFQVGDRFFKRAFYESSYSDADISWWDDVVEVFGEVVVTTAFRPKGN